MSPTNNRRKTWRKLALDKFTRIDVLVNNAAIFSTIPMNRGGIDTIDPAEWDRMMTVNLRGLFFCSRAVLPAMRQQKSGKIINISSGTVLNGSAGTDSLRHLESRRHRIYPHAGARSRRRQYQRQLPSRPAHAFGRKSRRRKFSNCAKPGSALAR